MADITQIKRMLADRAQDVAEMLLPGGRKDGQEWRAGSVAGEKGGSLGVHLTGSKAGVWKDFASDEGGDLLDLWIATKGGTIVDAITAASAYLGISIIEPYREPKKSFSRPPRPVCEKPKARVLDYLTIDRNIDGSVLELYKIGERGDDIIFPFILPDGVLALAKSRKAEDGASPKPTAANCEPVLFGWQAIPANARELILTEGEIDALSWASWGFAAMSIPFGGGKGGKQNWIENEFDRLGRFEKIYISTDMDEPGKEAAEEISNRLGRHRCYRVELPLKDANACLVDGRSKDEMAGYLASAKSLDPAGLKRTSEYADKVIHLFWPTNDREDGYTLPYQRLIDKVLFRPSEMTLWSGASGSGKSQIISDCTPHWVKHGSRICEASLEMKGEQSLRRMLKQTCGVDRPTEPFIRVGLQFLDPGLLLYERVGKASVGALLEVFDYARAKYGCDQFIIDSLMRLGIAGDDYTGQEKAVFQIVDWTIQHGVHTHLVAHSRKGERGQGAPETEDIKGAMEIGANAFNIMTVWRNRKLEEQVSMAPTDMEKSELMRQPGVILNVAKQRNGDFEGKVGLWFDQETYQYHDTSEGRMNRRQYVSMREQHERVA